VIGGGIVGLAIARELLSRYPGVKLVVIEKGRGVGQHQTGRSSGDVHAGSYYTPGSLRETLCRTGRQPLESYCAAHCLAFDKRGTLVVALDDHEAEILRTLHARAVENGLTNVRLIGQSEMVEIEPHMQGVVALHLPNTAVVDFGQVTEAIDDDIEEAGCTVRLGTAVRSLHVETGNVVQAALGDGELALDWVAICAGLYGDPGGRWRRPANRALSGRVLQLVAGRSDLVRALVYPVPKPNLPFLGVHLTCHVDGSVSVGPNAVLAWRSRAIADGTSRP
jgi:(S)-2-hydroxyglutarate dehydrogenase